MRHSVYGNQPAQGPLSFSCLNHAAPCTAILSMYPALTERLAVWKCSEAYDTLLQAPQAISTLESLSRELKTPGPT